MRHKNPCNLQMCGAAAAKHVAERGGQQSRGAHSAAQVSLCRFAQRTDNIATQRCHWPDTRGRHSTKRQRRRSLARWPAPCGARAMVHVGCKPPPSRLRACSKRLRCAAPHMRRPSCAPPHISAKRHVPPPRTQDLSPGPPLRIAQPLRSAPQNRRPIFAPNAVCASCTRPIRHCLLLLRTCTVGTGVSLHMSTSPFPTFPSNPSLPSLCTTSSPSYSVLTHNR